MLRQQLQLWRRAEDEAVLNQRPPASFAHSRGREAQTGLSLCRKGVTGRDGSKGAADIGKEFFLKQG